MFISIKTLFRTTFPALLTGLLVMLSVVANAGGLTPGSNAVINAGYRTLSYQATTAQGTRAYALSVWYPSTGIATTYNYGNVTSSIALNGAIESGLHPTIVFSHGDLGCANQSVFITESLAKAGYVVAAINYQDASTACGGSGSQADQPAFANANGWNSNSYLYRYYDTRALIDELQKQNVSTTSFLQGTLDLNRLGFIGHSLGGYTGAAMAGGWSSWFDSRIKAALLLSPYVEPFSVTTPNRVDIPIPVMLQGGTLDVGITPTLPAFYDRLNYQKYSLVLKTAGHFAWTNNTCSGFVNTDSCLDGSSLAAAIVSYGQSFLDTYVARIRSLVTTDATAALQSFQYSLATPAASGLSALVRISANDSSALQLQTGNALTIKLSFDPAQQLGKAADYYVWADTRLGLFSYSPASSFRFTPSGIPALSLRATAVKLTDYPLLTVPGLAVGDYTLNFRVVVDGTSTLESQARINVRP